MRVFPSGSVCALSPLGRGVRIDAKVPASRFIASPAVAAAAAFIPSCGFLTRCFGEGVAALVVHGILILLSRSGDIEREGLLPFCFICLLCLTASFTQTCCSAPQLVLAGLLAVVTGNCLRQLFSAPFQCRIFLLGDGRHSVRRVTLIGLCGTARQRRRRKQAEFFTYLIPSCAQVFFTCSVDVHSNGEGSGTMRACNLSFHVNCGQHRGTVTLTPQSCCVSLCRAGREIACGLLLLLCP
ncbi:hypothetical protein TcG_13072 [Trypanosoma cruzi]|uniref:Uncharacterized protein n=1 Tax=Trypanosoma cruzi Dm28c TaxID=1416333 RepID=V5B1K8_TRYCR|nr:hypothetical protein TCDM_10975 [Trypanosoma cruzi Dm28c]RNE96285.1 hypothetical protein TcG_13072 [Trypanosoma cruzi]